MRRHNRLLYWITAIITVAVVIATVLEAKACDGRLVRGLVWWECVP